MQHRRAVSSAGNLPVGSGISSSRHSEVGSACDSVSHRFIRSAGAAPRTAHLLRKIGILTAQLGGRNFCAGNDNRGEVAAGDSNSIIAEAAVRSGCNVCHVTDSRRVFEFLRADLYKTDLAIIDVDPGIHSMSILEAIAACDSAPPIIVVTGFEESEMTPIAHRHGAAACIAKPFTAVELVALIEEVCPMAEPSISCTCDLWGHPYRSRKQIMRNARPVAKGGRSVLALH